MVLHNRVYASSDATKKQVYLSTFLSCLGGFLPNCVRPSVNCVKSTGFFIINFESSMLGMVSVYGTM